MKRLIPIFLLISASLAGVTTWRVENTMKVVEPFKVFVEPDKNFATIDDVFHVNLYVKGGSARSIIINFTFDCVELIDSETYDLFDFEFIKNNLYVGISERPIDLSKKTKIATLTFKAVCEGFVCFNATANVDGENSSVIVGCVQISKFWERYDEDNDGCISDVELVCAILDWLDGRITDDQLVEVIIIWL
ncbi:MAG: hypothetical protein DRP01_07445 [Archaeoglobales archaeon]|nr:MAG: hypothetical protein DRP01_07445 [Archaeoglobales archaeon]